MEEDRIDFLKLLGIVVGVSFVFCLFFWMIIPSGSGSIGVVSYDHIVENSKAGISLRENLSELDTNYTKYLNTIKEDIFVLRAKYNALKDTGYSSSRELDQVRRDIEQKGILFQTSLNEYTNNRLQARREAVDLIMKKAREVVNDLLKKKGIVIIIDASDPRGAVVDKEKVIDVSEEAVKKLDTVLDSIDKFEFKPSTGEEEEEEEEEGEE